MTNSMTVKELIEALQHYNPTYGVVIEVEEDGEWRNLTSVRDDADIDVQLTIDGGVPFVVVLSSEVEQDNG